MASLPPDRDLLLDALRLGLGRAPDDMHLEWREWRWFALLPAHVVFVADGNDAWSRLRREAMLLASARAVIGDAIPEVAFEDAALRLQVRQRMSGIHGYAIEAKIFGVAASEATPNLAPGLRYAEHCPLTAWGRTFAVDLGRTLAGFHRAIPADEARAIGFAPSVTDWDHIARVLQPHPYLARAAQHVQRWDASRSSDAVVLHGDPHYFNMFASDDGNLRGLVDVGDAALGDRHEDLRYLHSSGPVFARLAMDAYADEAGVVVDAHTVARFHVHSALGHFAWIAPDAPRFPSIVAWATEALALTPEWTVA